MAPMTIRFGSIRRLDPCRGPGISIGQPTALPSPARGTEGPAQGMTRRASRRILWLSFLLTVPVPFWAFEGGRVPTAWLFEVAAFTGALLWSEGGSVTALVFGVLVAQAILAAIALYLVARTLTRMLFGARAEIHVAWIASVVGVLLVLACFRIYRTPFVADGRAVNIVGIFR